jgi:hypothetical protein
MSKATTYIAHDFSTGWPVGTDLYYECQICGDLVPTVQDGQCRCGNVYVDASGDRAGANDESKVRLVKKTS